MERMNSSVAGVYGLLATIFAKEIGKTMLDKLREPSLREAFAELGLDSGEAFYTGDANRLLEDLAVEFTGLFIGPGNFISPHESVHHVREDGDYGRLWGADTVAVKKIVEAAGLNYQDDFAGMPDHIAAEFEFMQKLEERYAQALQESEQELADHILQIKNRFFTEHIVSWVPDFMEKVADKATMQFYREMARLSQRFIDQEMQLIQRNSEVSSTA